MCRWRPAWVLLWYSTFFSCSAFREKQLALLQTFFPIREHFLCGKTSPICFKCPRRFILHPREHPDGKKESTRGHRNSWNAKKKKKNKKKSIHLDIWGTKHLECWKKTPQTALLTNSWNPLSSWGFTVGFISPPTPPTYIRLMCLQS